MTFSDWMSLTGKTDAEVAKHLGVDRVSVTRYRLGSRIPDWDVMPRIVELTRGAVTPNDFMPRDGSGSKKKVA
jgi:transcriptional regulator with XRE-family HTH domain